MATLWADGWFYISAGCFLVSCVLFVFLLGQYRSAVEAEDEDMDVDLAGKSAESTPAERVYVPKGLSPAPFPEPAAAMPILSAAAAVVPAIVKSVSAPQVPAEKPAPKPAAAPAEAPVIKPAAAPAAATAAPAPAVKKSEATTTGGLSPAVVYLQNLKTQMDRLDKEITGLKSLAGQHATQNEMILKHLAELADKLDKVSVAPPAAAPTTASAGPAEPEPEPASALPETLEIAPRPAAPAVEMERPAAEPAAEPMKTIELEIAARVAAPAPEPAAAPEPEPAPAAAPPAPESDKTMIIEPTVAPIKLTDTKTIPLPKPPGFELSVETPAAEPVPAPAAAPGKPSDEPAELPKPARKGPVWPI